MGVRKKMAEQVSIMDDGIRLSAVLEKPDKDRCPLVIFLHGFTSSKDRPHSIASCRRLTAALNAVMLCPDVYLAEDPDFRSAVRVYHLQEDYLQRHTDMQQRCSTGATVRYLTTENPDKFSESARIFLHEPVNVEHITLEG